MVVQIVDDAAAVDRADVGPRVQMPLARRSAGSQAGLRVRPLDPAPVIRPRTSGSQRESVDAGEGCGDERSASYRSAPPDS